MKTILLLQVILIIFLFKIDLIVWKLKSIAVVVIAQIMFKIDLIVWKRINGERASDYGIFV